MPKDEKTSSEVASAAGRLIRHKDPKVRSVAASALNQAPDKKKYVCATAMDFEGLNPPVHCKAGDPIPKGLTEQQIKEYLKGGLIEEVK